MRDWVAVLSPELIDQWQEAIEIYPEITASSDGSGQRCLVCQGAIEFARERRLTGRRILSYYIHGQGFSDFIGFVCGGCLTEDGRRNLQRWA